MNWVIDLAKTYSPAEGEANLFGVIIYTDVHVYVKKMLRDNDYWQALDEISGPRWAVFATKAVEGEYEFPNFPPGHMGMMRLVWKEPRANKELLDAFEINSTSDLPVIVVFAQNREGELYKNTLKIDNSSEEEAFKSVSEILTTVAQALEKVDKENLQNNVNTFHAVGYAISNYKQWQAIKRGVSVVERIRDLLGY